ncbi:hypothetical protein RND71_044229 [Anisodus tanguticus]|uniref:Uncharacterized protein n=1 Tax=Anisodus tanguticus TaxID=243964 RepID=A0AAE1QNC0_9SOLA|nr:hypothetical protein RND71_044229 [Anisodus tanguticus]
MINGKSFPISSMHQRGLSLNRASRENDDNLDLFSKIAWDRFGFPKGKRSMPNARPRKVTEQFLCNGGESMIKKAVENNNYEEQESGVFKINLAAGVRNQEFFRLKKS